MDWRLAVVISGAGRRDVDPRVTARLISPYPDMCSASLRPFLGHLFIKLLRNAIPVLALVGNSDSSTAIVVSVHFNAGSLSLSLPR